MLLSMASPAGSSHYQKWKFDRMVPYVDFFNMMAYDYADPRPWCSLRLGLKYLHRVA